jgi:hypothetical protein
VPAPTRVPRPRERAGRRTGGPTSEGEKICHIVGPDNPDRALCGKNVTGYPWNPPWPTCVVCVDLYEQGRGRA